MTVRKEGEQFTLLRRQCDQARRVSLNFRSQLDPAFLKRERIFERVGWLLLGLVILAAIIGLFGGGPISDAEVTTSSGNSRVELRYERWGRMESPLGLRLAVSAPDETAEELTLTIPNAFANKIEVHSLLPEPEATSVGENGANYSWQVDDWSQPLLITLNYKAKEWRNLGGTLHVTAGQEALAALKFSQFLFP